MYSDLRLGCILALSSMRNISLRTVAMQGCICREKSKPSNGISLGKLCRTPWCEACGACDRLRGDSRRRRHSKRQWSHHSHRECPHGESSWMGERCKIFLCALTCARTLALKTKKNFQSTLSTSCFILCREKYCNLPQSL